MAVAAAWVTASCGGGDQGASAVAPAAAIPVVPAVARTQAKSAPAPPVTASPVAVARTGPVQTSHVTIRTSNGRLVTAVNGGGVGGPDDGPGSAALHTDVASPTPGPWETFECVAVGPDRLAFRTSRGTYLTAVNGGGIGGPNADPYEVHTDAKQVGPWEQFDLVWLGDGKCALRTRDGHWVTAVHGGGWGEAANAYPIHTDATRIGPWEIFWIGYESTALPRRPLAGTVRGRRFVGVSAFATRSAEGPDARSVWIYDRTASCVEAAHAVEGGRALEVELQWEPGGQGAASTGMSSGGARGTTYSMSAEMDEAPTKPGSKVTVALEVHGEGEDVAGEIPVTVCP